MAYLIVETDDPGGVDLVRRSEEVKADLAGPFETALGAVGLLLRRLTPVELQRLKAELIPVAFRAFPQTVVELAPPVLTDAEADRLLAAYRAEGRR